MSEQIQFENTQSSIIIKGEISDIIYQNDDNGYTVFEVETEKDIITATGITPGLFVGEKITLCGEWTNHQIYGEQFHVTSFEKEMPNDTDSMLRYLTSGAVKGIGPKTAMRIIERFGDSSFEVIESAPEMLCEIKGISPKKAMEISENFNQQFGMRNVMIFFSEYFGPSISAKIYKKWGSASIDIVKENPYVLCEQISGIGFEKADIVSKSLGSPIDSTERITAGISYVLKYNAQNNGHLFLPYNKLVDSTSNMLCVSRDRVEECINSEISRANLICYDFKNRAQSEIPDNNCGIFLYDNFYLEKKSAERLTVLSKFKIDNGFFEVEKQIEIVEELDGIKYSPIQKKCIADALSSSVYILTGGPGTGKTTIIRGIIKILNNLGLRFALAAPTGRASKRITESTQYDAKTIHRLLEYEYSDDDDEPSFLRDESNPLDYDAIIVDEASMIDIFLFYSLLRAIRPGTRFIIIGDYYQLPSVGPGTVLKDIINCDKFNVGKLSDIYRQSSESSIVINAHSINSGIYPDLSNKNNDYFFISRSSASDVRKTVIDLCANRLPKKYGIEIIDDIQVLCATRKGETGTTHLNNSLQSVINAPSNGKNEISMRGVIFREGDKVIQTRNNYDIEWSKDNLFGEENGNGIFNGDIGKIVEIDLENKTFKISFDGKTAVYDTSMMEDIEHAYAITIHKSQGSEYPVVILPVFDGAPLLMTRNLLYTATTRAKKMVIIVGSENAIKRMVDNCSDIKRYTAFKTFLEAQ